MKFSRPTSIAVAPVPLAIFDLLQILHKPDVLTVAYCSAFLLVFPGVLITKLAFSSLAKNKGIFLVVSVAMSVAYLMLIGVTANVFAAHSLNKLNLILVLNVSILALLTPVFIRSREHLDYTHCLKTISNISLKQCMFWVLPILPVFVAIGGAIRLNNGGTNIVSLVALVGTFLLVFSPVVIKKRPAHYLPWVLFCASLTLLLMTSLRSSYVSGWDISTEFKVFEQTSSAAHWSISNVNRAYTSCLSITILPTVIKALSRFPDEYIYKLLYPILFSITPVALYYAYRNFLSKSWAFFAALFVISQQAYFLEFPAVARQEIALLFFASSIMVLFCKKISLRTRRALFLICALSIIVSHYSTAYVAIAIFLLGFVVLRVVSWRSSRYDTSNSVMSGGMTLIILLFGIMWYSQITNISSGLTAAVEQTATHISSTLNGSLINNTVEEAVFSQQVSNKGAQRAFTKYLNANTSHKTTNVNYNPMLLPHDNVSPVSSLLADVLRDIYIPLKYLLVTFVISGSFLWFFKGKDLANYGALAVVSVVVMTALIILPEISNDYNFERLFQQTLFITSACGIWLLMNALQRLFGTKTQILIAVCLVGFLVYQTGVLTKYTGGDTTMNLSNSGSSYQAQYVFGGERIGVAWLNATIANQVHIRISADAYDELKLIAFGKNIYQGEINDVVVPGNISSTSYVFAGYTNISDEKGLVDGRGKFGNGIYWYNFPTAFLQDNENTIYANGQAEIYH